MAKGVPRKMRYVSRVCRNVKKLKTKRFGPTSRLWEGSEYTCTVGGEIISAEFASLGQWRKK